MNLRLFAIIAAIFILSIPGLAQVNTLMGQITDSPAESFAGGISADGRFIVFESRGDLATENPRNADGNREIFLFDYAQRRIFQITDTKSVVFDPTITTYVFTNIRVEIANIRPVISADGRWIAFSSNATSATPATPADLSNPGSFDGNALTAATPTPTPTVTPTPNPTATPTPSPTPSSTPTPGANPLTSDANLEMWLYEVPSFAPVADLSAGDDLALTNLAGGTFTRVTNTPASQMPRAATTVFGAFVADDNHDASISDDGSVLAFVSNRDLVTGNNPGPPVSLTEDNDEIFTYLRVGGATRQITKTPRGPISNPIYNKYPTISGNGTRVSFSSTGDDPIWDGASTNFDTGSNPASSRNEEVFYANLNAAGTATGGKQVTTTTSTNLGDPVNIYDPGRRMSKDGRFIAFDSYADLANEHNAANQTSFALYLYDATANTFRRIGPRSTADSVVNTAGGDVAHYPGFTDNDVNGTPATLVFETRNNIKADGTVPANANDGLNPDPVRPPQLYSYPLAVAPSSTFTRMSRFTANFFLTSTQALTTDTLRRMAFNFGANDFGTGNFDNLSEVYYFLKPVESTATSRFGPSFYTGATGLPISIAATPTPTPSSSPTPTPSPTATPTPSPTPVDPVTPAQVPGMSPGMLVRMEFGRSRPILTRTASVDPPRAPRLPFEMSGVTLGIKGVACGLRFVSPDLVIFVTPVGLASPVSGTPYDLVLNVAGTVSTHLVPIIPVQPDIFNTAMTATPGGRARLLNVTNRVYTTEPFVIRTIQRHGNMLVPSVLRLYLTGVANVDGSLISIRIGNKTMTGLAGFTSLAEPGVYTVDFPLDPGLEGALDRPVVVTVTVNGVTFTSRVDDTTSRTSIL